MRANCSRSFATRAFWAAKLRAVIADRPAPIGRDLEDLAPTLLDATGIDRPEDNPKRHLDGRDSARPVPPSASSAAPSSPPAAADATTRSPGHTTPDKPVTLQADGPVLGA